MVFVVLVTALALVMLWSRISRERPVARAGAGERLTDLRLVRDHGALSEEEYAARLAQRRARDPRGGPPQA